MVLYIEEAAFFKIILICGVLLGFLIGLGVYYIFSNLSRLN